MSTAETEEALVKVLLDSGILSADKVDAARKAKESANGETLGDLLVKHGSLKPRIKEVIETRIREGHTGPLKKLGKYILIRKLGEGAMGAVFMGLEIEGDSAAEVAVKVLKKELTQGNKTLVDRFLREAKSAVALTHENIVSAKGAGEEDGFHYYVMDYFEGEPLDVMLKRDKKIGATRAVEIIIDAAKGLGYAHGLGFIHRDIKPANIYLTKDGPAKLLDFGLVKNVDQASQEALTAPGTVMGSPHYISPEQVKGGKDIDRRTDLYSLGATLFHMVCGRPPFQGSSAATVIMAHISQPPPEPRTLSSEVPPGLSQVILRMMAKERDQRYPSCEALLKDLEEVRAGREPKFQPAAFPSDPAGSNSADEFMTTVIAPPEELERTRMESMQSAHASKPAPTGKPWWQFWMFWK
ncbi:MAG: serine/threonine protein kinase [Planctomycetota bacterium]|nr:serine/threonine protein kinase [Planctomycetota bacterium]